MKLAAPMFLLCACALAQHPTLPNPTLTPGAVDPAVTQSTIGKTVCLDGYTKTVRSVTLRKKREVVARYGIPVSDLPLVEIDHFISLEIGGSNDVSNLWPQYYSGNANYLGARQKDVVETHLAHEVCSGKITLGEAQLEIRDWVKVYLDLKAKK